MTTVYCPVKDGQIDGGDCLVVCDIADRLIKASAAPEGIQWSEEQRQKCLRCQYHADLSEE